MSAPAPPHIPGLSKYPDLVASYYADFRREWARCGGNCMTGAVVQRYARQLRQRQSTKARP